MSGPLAPEQTPDDRTLYARLMHCLDDALARLDIDRPVETRRYIQGAQVLARLALRHGLDHGRDPAALGHVHNWDYIGGVSGPRDIHDLYLCESCGERTRVHRVSLRSEVGEDHGA